MTSQHPSHTLMTSTLLRTAEGENCYELDSSRRLQYQHWEGRSCRLSRTVWVTHSSRQRPAGGIQQNCVRVRARTWERHTDRKTDEKRLRGAYYEACYPDYIQALAQKQNFCSCFVLVLEIEPGTSNTLLPLTRGSALEKKCVNMGFFFMFIAEPDSVCEL